MYQITFVMGPEQEDSETYVCKSYTEAITYATRRANILHRTEDKSLRDLFPEYEFPEYENTDAGRGFQQFGTNYHYVTIEESEPGWVSPERHAEAIERARAEGAAEALREASDEIERELVCCDAYERGDHLTRHQICYWGAAAASLNRRRATRIESGHDSADGKAAVAAPAPRRYSGRPVGSIWRRLTKRRGGDR